MFSLRHSALLLLLWMAAGVDPALSIKCHECGQFSKEKGIIEACNKTQTSDADRKECHHTSILCLKHVNGKRMVKMCTDFCQPYKENGGDTYCCAMPDYCNTAPCLSAAGSALLVPALLLTAPLQHQTVGQWAD